MAAKYLTKWRPDFQDRLAPKKEEDEITMTNNGALS